MQEGQCCVVHRSTNASYSHSQALDGVSAPRSPCHRGAGEPWRHNRAPNIRTFQCQFPFLSPHDPALTCRVQIPTNASLTLNPVVLFEVTFPVPGTAASINVTMGEQIPRKRT